VRRIQQVLSAKIEETQSAIRLGRKASCRFCGVSLRHTFVDLGMSPLCESYVPQERLNEMEPFYPLHALVCESCKLVQLDEYVTGVEIFDDYAYFSSYSDSWVQHAQNYVDLVSDRFGLNSDSIVFEVASNDGYLLQHFVSNRVPVLGIEPAANVAEAAIQKGIPTIVTYLTETSAGEIVAEHGEADLVVANNVYAHVPALNDFTKGLKTLMKSDGVLTIEVQHLWRLMEFNQFDTIYHEHFQYYSLISAERVLAANGLSVFDVEELGTHGGSLRLYAKHSDDSTKSEEPRLASLRTREIEHGFDRLETYLVFGERVRETKRKLLEFLIKAKREGKTIVGYGAPGKGNTLLNYCGIRQDFIDFTVDRNPYKQGRYLPGTHIPILAPEALAEARPDYVLILPWNLRQEIIGQLTYVREWGGRFVIPIPEVEVIA
jgi:SAM-dependent methyltransferase